MSAPSGGLVCSEHGMCSGCGYALRGLAGQADPRCPECGRVFDPADRSTFRDRRNRDVLGGRRSGPPARRLARWTNGHGLVRLACVAALTTIVPTWVVSWPWGEASMWTLTFAYGTAMWVVAAAGWVSRSFRARRASRAGHGRIARGRATWPRLLGSIVIGSAVLGTKYSTCVHGTYVSVGLFTFTIRESPQGPCFNERDWVPLLAAPWVDRP